MATLPHLGPTVALLEGQGGRHGQPGGDVARALPLQPTLQHGAAGVGVEPAVALGAGHVAPAGHGGVQHLVVLLACVQEGTALGSAQPLVAVAGVEVGAQGVKLHLDVAWCMGAVDQGQHPQGACVGAQGRQGKDQRRGGGDVAREDQSGAPRHLGQQPLGEPRVVQRQGNLHLSVDRSGLLANTLPGGIAGAVFVVRGQNLVAWPQVQRACHHVDAGGGVGHEDQVRCLCPEVVRQGLAGLRQQLARAPSEKLHRVSFHLPLPVLQVLEHFARAGPERAVIQEHDLGIQEKVRLQRGSCGVVHHPDFRGAGPGPAIAHAVLRAGRGPPQGLYDDT